MANQAHWIPKQTEHLKIVQFRNLINQKYSQNLSNYADLHQFSTENREEFWQTLADFCDVTWNQQASEVLLRAEHMIDDKWFVGSRLNYAENILKHTGNTTAITSIKENGETQILSFDELYQAVAKFQQHLIAQGVTKGDRVAALMPNCAETIIAMLATTALGAVWTSTSPDFGVEGVVDRFGQVQAKILITANAYHYNGKVHSCLDKIEKITQRIPSIEQTVIVPFVEDHPIELSQPFIAWKDALHASAKTVNFEPVEFHHPLFILYSSGTTGKPKCIIHGTGGILLQHKKELMLHSELNPEDTLFYFTTCGWMMWNWMVSGLTVGASLLLYDGSPFYPDGNRLLDIAESHQVTHFGTSAKWISAIQKAGIEPQKGRNFESLRAIFSTGSPLMPESYDYVYQQWKNEVCLSSISGGTDICSCFALGNPALPVFKGELQCLGLGMDVKILNDSGEPVLNEAGELSCVQSFPVMPVGFWDDADFAKYKSAYFETFENIWCHGDLAKITSNGGLVIYGRSDATLNPGGVRIGTAEIYRQVEKLDEVIESIAVGQSWQEDVRVILFVVLKPELELDQNLIDKIKLQVRNNTTPRHVPAKILQVTEIPKTLSGKIVELAVKKTIHGKAVNNTDALANPEALEQYKNRPELNS